jgi:hypothetical protein
VARDQPPQRVVPARILIASRWLRARLHLPGLQPLGEFLGQRAPFLPLTQAVLPGGRQEVAFPALAPDRGVA